MNIKNKKNEFFFKFTFIWLNNLKGTLKTIHKKEKKNTHKRQRQHTK